MIGDIKENGSYFHVNLTRHVGYDLNFLTNLTEFVGCRLGTHVNLIELGGYASLSNCRALSLRVKVRLKRLSLILQVNQLVLKFLELMEVS